MMNYKGIVKCLLGRLKAAGRAEVYKVITIFPFESLLSHSEETWHIIGVTRRSE
jgi:hypothetical protein